MPRKTPDLYFIKKAWRLIWKYKSSFLSHNFEQLMRWLNGLWWLHQSFMIRYSFILSFYWEIDKSLPGEIDKDLSFLVGSLFYSAFVFYFSDDFLLCAARSLFHACLHWEWLLPGIRACNTYFREFEFSVSIHNSLKHRVWSRVLVATCSYWAVLEVVSGLFYPFG